MNGILIAFWAMATFATVMAYAKHVADRSARIDAAMRRHPAGRQRDTQ